VRRTTLILALAAILFGVLASGLQARSQRVSFRTEDGVTVVATWYEPLDSARGRPVGPSPAVVLVHMLNRSRRDWEPFASRLAFAGIGALAIDLRGHGDSDHPRPDPATPNYTPMLRDIQAARRFLAGRADVIPSRIGIAGASLGANLSALAAADGSFTAVALLSPSLDYRGLRIEAALKKYGKRPLMLVASDDDPYARRSALELQKTLGTVQLLMLPAAGHGTRMFDRAPDLSYALVEFFRRVQ
jgi:pimeloyl-ACP methyl ester carboxylesterase